MRASPRQSLLNILRGVAYAAAIVAPLLLLLDPQAAFPEDWAHHLWMIGYHGEYFRQHGDMPLIVNTTAAVGVAQPVFYGYLLYPLLGLLAAPLGASLALRIGVLAVMVLQFRTLLVAGRNVFRSAALNYTVAASVVWATYSLTNLYNRGAIAEYFATAFLVIAVAFAAAVATGPAPGRRAFHASMAGLFLVLTVGAHPPTAVVASAFFALLAVGILVGSLRDRLKLPTVTALLLGGGAAVGAVILLPWIYAAASFGPKLGISHTKAFLFLPEHSDSWWGRFAPYPYDLLSTESGISDLGAAYLEAPLNLVLLAVLLWNLELCRRDPTRSGRGDAAGKGVLIVAVGWFLFLVTLSVSPALADRFRFFAPYVQYVYRLVSHCNVALLAAVFASGILVARGDCYRRFRDQTNVVVAACLTLAVLGLLIKLQHAGVVQRQSVAPEFTLAGERVRLVTKGRSQLAEDYNVPGLVRELTDGEALPGPAAIFPVGSSGAAFGMIGPVKIEMKTAAWAATNAVVFPWMELTVDGRKVEREQLARTGHFFAVHLPAGSHELQAVWRPDRAWSLMHRVSQFVFAIILVGTLGWAAAELRGTRAA